MLAFIHEKKLIPWRSVWKKATSLLNVFVVAMAVTYPMLPADIRTDLGTWVTVPFAIAAVFNTFIGNLRQKNLPPA